MKHFDTRSARPLVGLALGGGAARGIAHIGVLEALIDNGIPIDRISGTSAGAIVAAAFAFGISPQELKERTKHLSWYSLSSFPDSTLGLASNRALERMMETLLGKKDIEEAAIPLAITATDVEKGTGIIFRKGSAAQAVRASSCIPGLFAPVMVGGRKLLDGALVENVPLSPLKDMRADIMIGVNLVHWHAERPVHNALDVLANAMDIVTAHQEKDPLRDSSIIIEPDLAGFSSSDFKKLDALVEAGYRATIKKIPEIKEQLAKRSKKKMKAKGWWNRIQEWLKA